MSTSFPTETVESIGKILLDKTVPLKDRFRALFTLRNLGGTFAIDAISACFDDPSALLKHELAYCLGQMQDKYALPILTKVLEDTDQEPMVRHEAGEALGAIGCKESLEILQKHAQDPVTEVAETCKLALKRLEWLHNPEQQQEVLSINPYSSIDPAPPSPIIDIPTLKAVLLDDGAPLFQRYRSMFALRNIGTLEAVEALAQGLKCGSALFRHEVAYVIGQTQHPSCIQQLTDNLQDLNENPMVRHECAEALGAIATEKCNEILQKHAGDSERVVRESCVVALDMSEYENSPQFQYADTLTKVTSTN